MHWEAFMRYIPQALAAGFGRVMIDKSYQV
jgi:hypothetical protein